MACLTLTAALTQEGDGYVARCLEVEMASQGATIDGALDALREALELRFDDADLPIPTRHPLVTVFEITI